jgi:LmbE family N-acetylglucosaminyl deacetylase
MAVSGEASGPEKERALVVVAHPDDVDFGAAGTVATWVAEGIEVSYCLCTNGDAGGFDPAVPRSEIAGIRQEEQRAAGKELGVDEVLFLGYPDGQLVPSFELRRDISRVIRQKRPHRVLMQSPEILWDRLPASHPDHRAAGEATLAAVYPDARNPFTHTSLREEEGLEAWTVHDLWVMGAQQPNTWVDITDVFDRKLAALRRHVSQTSHMHDLEALVHGWGENQASAGGLQQGRLAEPFRRVAIR